MELREQHAACGQGIDSRRLDVAAVCAEIRVAEIIGNDQEDVRPAGRVGLRRRTVDAGWVTATRGCDRCNEEQRLESSSRSVSVSYNFV